MLKNTFAGIKTEKIAWRRKANLECEIVKHIRKHIDLDC